MKLTSYLAVLFSCLYSAIGFAALSKPELNRALIRQEDGSWIGTFAFRGAEQSVMLTRFLPSGKIDSSFGENGFFLLKETSDFHFLKGSSIEVHDVWSNREKNELFIVASTNELKSGAARVDIIVDFLKGDSGKGLGTDIVIIKLDINAKKLNRNFGGIGAAVVPLAMECQSANFVPHPGGNLYIKARFSDDEDKKLGAVIGLSSDGMRLAKFGRRGIVNLDTNSVVKLPESYDTPFSVGVYEKMYVNKDGKLLSPVTFSKESSDGSSVTHQLFGLSISAEGETGIEGRVANITLPEEADPEWHSDFGAGKFWSVVSPSSAGKKTVLRYEFEGSQLRKDPAFTPFTFNCMSRLCSVTPDRNGTVLVTAVDSDRTKAATFLIGSDGKLISEQGVTFELGLCLKLFL